MVHGCGAGESEPRYPDSNVCQPGQIQVASDSRTRVCDGQATLQVDGRSVIGRCEHRAGTTYYCLPADVCRGRSPVVVEGSFSCDDAPDPAPQVCEAGTRRCASSSGYQECLGHMWSPPFECSNAGECAEGRCVGVIEAFRQRCAACVRARGEGVACEGLLRSVEEETSICRAQAPTVEPARSRRVSECALRRDEMYAVLALARHENAESAAVDACDSLAATTPFPF